MAIPGNMWIHDDGGALTKVGAMSREESLVLSLKGFTIALLFLSTMQLENLPVHVNTLQ